MQRRDRQDRAATCKARPRCSGTAGGGHVLVRDKIRYGPSRVRHATTRSLSLASDHSRAIRGCDTYVRKEVVPGTLSQGLLRTARWRWEPATASQKTMIMKRWKDRKVVGAADGRRRAVLATEEGLKSMTKGEAANIITRLKYGAQVTTASRDHNMAQILTRIPSDPIREEEESYGEGGAGRAEGE